jgi:hypothetical protein
MVFYLISARMLAQIVLFHDLSTLLFGVYPLVSDRALIAREVSSAHNTPKSRATANFHTGFSAAFLAFARIVPVCHRPRFGGNVIAG